MEQPTTGGADQVKARLRATVESYLRSATISHLRDEVAVRQYIDHQADKMVETLLRDFKIERR